MYVAGKFQYRASFSETTLPEMLYAIDRFRVPGVIEARNQGVVKRVYIRDGHVIHAGSNDRRDSLGDYLVRTEKLSAEQFDAISRERARSRERFGVLLIRRQLLSPGEVYEAIREHIEEIVWSLFFWQEGEVNFSVGEYQEEDMVQIQIPMRRVIVQGIARAAEAKPLVSRLGRKETVFRPSFRWEDLIEIGLNAEEFQLLGLVDGIKTLYQLCAEGPHSPAENAKLLYAFKVLHLVERVNPETERTGPLKIQLPTTGDGYA